MPEPPVRPGRRPSPSRWSERAPVAALAAAGLCVSLYLAAYQLGVLAAPWDPIFGAASSERVLRSALSRALPIPDAALGAIAYAAELAADLAGGVERWRTHPRVVLLFGAIAAGLAVVSAGLIAFQLAVVRAACALCLASAAISLVVAARVATGDEVPAAVHVVAGRARAREAER